MTLKFCKDCVYFVGTIDEAESMEVPFKSCTVPENQSVDLLYGKVTFTHDAYTMRSPTGRCGEGARLFEPRVRPAVPPKERRWSNFFGWFE